MGNWEGDLINGLKGTGNLVTLAERMTRFVFFAKPYHSWERGTNENRNGVVRKVLPKGRSFDDITEEEMRRIDYTLRPPPRAVSPKGGISG